MKIKFQSSRNASGSGSHTAGHIQKTSSDKLLLSIDYSNIISGIDFIDSVTVTAATILGADVTSDLIETFSTGNKVEGTADSGSKTSLVDESTDFVSKGFEVGDTLLNVTKGQRMRLNAIKTVDADYPYAQVEFETQEIAVEASDAWKALFAPTYLKGGVDGTIYELTFTMTSDSGLIVRDKILLTVKD